MIPVRSWLTRLFSYYRAYHQPSPLLLRYMSVLALIGYPGLYLLRFVKDGSRYDDFVLRLFIVATLVVLLVRDRWPASLKPYYLHFSYVVVTIALPFTFVFTALKNGGGAASVGNTFMAVFLLMLLADWRNMIVMLVSGFTLAGVLYAATDPDPTIPMDYVGRLPVLLAGLLGGSLFKFALEQATAERVRQAYASLAGSIAHEMRNPMAQVRHSLENIRHALPVPSLHAQRQFIEGRSVDLLYRHVAQGEMAVKRGLQVIAMTLDEVNAKPLDPGKLVFLSAAEVCAKAVEEYGYENEQQRARVAMSIKDDVVFRGDETAFLFVLFNLMKNALYYLPAYPDARLLVSVGGGAIAVRDTGPGMAPEVVTRLFEPFGTRGKSGGTGLGLAYCRRVVQAFGGQIRCESILGSHTEFTMTFPVVESQELQAQRLAVMAEGRRMFAGRRVLVVDDDAGLRMATRTKLAPLGCVIDEASDGVEAIRLLRERAYHLVVLDLNMPRMDGYELAESVRSGQAPMNRDICLVAHTSEPVHLARVKTENAGMDGFIAKPSEQVTLVQALCRAADVHARTKAHPAGWLAGRRLLLGDDNAYNRAAVGAYLKHSGAIVMEVGSGEAVLRELALPQPCDAVLLDIHMPGMNGIDTARAIRARDWRHSAVPILAITAHAGPELVETGLAAGIGDFITKPVEAELLYEKLGQLMGLAPPLRAVAERAPASRERDALLDENRLEGYRRIGVLSELVDEYVPEINLLVEGLESAVAQRDLQSSLEVLHSLVGMSGEAGAQALHRLARDVYIPMLEDQSWPAMADWVGRIRELAAQTNEALRDWTAAQTRADA